MTDKLIESDPSIMMDKPVVAVTCFTVELILEKLAALHPPKTNDMNLQ